MSAAPDYIEPFQAWRVWRVLRVDGTYRLGSIVQRALWPTDSALRAQCQRTRLFRRRRHEHDAPDLGCECGIYAGGLEQLRLYVTEGLRAPLSRVIGQVALWGTVVECEHGFRASHAYPSLLYVPEDVGAAWQTEWANVAIGVCDYGVPVEPLPAPIADAPSALAATPLRRAL